MLMPKRQHAVVVLLLIVLLAAGQVWLSHLRVGVAQSTASLQKIKGQVGQEVQNLRLELASLTRPDTLRRLSREKLGMHSPKPTQVVRP